VVFGLRNPRVLTLFQTNDQKEMILGGSLTGRKIQFNPGKSQRKIREELRDAWAAHLRTLLNMIFALWKKG